MISSFSRASLFCRFSSLISSLASISSFTRADGSGEAHCQSLLAGGESESQGDVRLAGSAVAYGDDVLATLDVLAARELGHELPVHRRYGREVEGVQALYGGEARGLILRATRR